MSPGGWRYGNNVDCEASKAGIALGIAALFLGSALSASAITPLPLSGSLGGQVKNAVGVARWAPP